ncbi:hypothetical protein Bra471DRAFT_03802 [Bradyrhizobium sp. WSM471]|nr:hypothetical protein Bra471DRAFT_03802 [Bradyrhizobium sp. WSM471]
MLGGVGNWRVEFRERHRDLLRRSADVEGAAHGSPCGTEE